MRFPRMGDKGNRRARALLAVIWGGAGAVMALALAADVHAPIGPVDATLSLRPSLSGDTLVRLAPLGTIRLDTHDAPVSVEVRVDELRLEEAEAIAADPSVLSGVEDQIADDTRDALRRLMLRAVLVAVVGGALAALATSVWSGPRALLATGLVGALTAGVLAGATIGASVATWRPDAVGEPEYSGLLTVAPRAVGDARAIVDRFGEYRAQLADLVGNVADLYQTGLELPLFEPDDDTVRLLHVSDIHLNPQAFDLMSELVDRFGVDAVVDTGDITDWGSEPETALLERIPRLDVPYVWVRGNHDSPATQAALGAQPNAVVLDGSTRTVAGLRMLGLADTRFTPEKDKPTGKDVERREAEGMAPVLASAVRRAGPGGVDLVLVHDARVAAGVGGRVPLVLAGHTHAARRSHIGSTPLLVQGSTGGAGLRALQGDEPEPLTCSVLYFDRASRRLVAYDQITVEGLGRRGVRIERHTLASPRPTTTTTTTSSAGG